MYLISRQPPIPSIRGTTRNSGSIPSTLPLFPFEEWPESIVEVFLEQQASHLVVSTQDQPFVPAPAEGKETHVDPMFPEPKIRIHIVMAGCRTNQTIDVDGAVPASHLPPFIVAFQLGQQSRVVKRIVKQFELTIPSDVLRRIIQSIERNEFDLLAAPVVFGQSLKWGQIRLGILDENNPVDQAGLLAQLEIQGLAVVLHPQSRVRPIQPNRSGLRIDRRRHHKQGRLNFGVHSLSLAIPNSSWTTLLNLLIKNCTFPENP